MKQLLPLFTLLIFLMSCKDVKNETEVPSPELQNIVDNFFRKYESSPSDAISYIFSTNKSFAPIQITELQNKFAVTANIIGAFNGYEQITTKKTSASLVLFSYLVKHDK